MNLITLNHLPNVFSEVILRHPLWDLPWSCSDTSSNSCLLVNLSRIFSQVSPFNYKPIFKPRPRCHICSAKLQQCKCYNLKSTVACTVAFLLRFSCLLWSNWVNSCFSWTHMWAKLTSKVKQQSQLKFHWPTELITSFTCVLTEFSYSFQRRIIPYSLNVFCSGGCLEACEAT